MRREYEAWLAQLLQHGLLKPSFIPPAPQRELRELTRYRSALVADRVQLINRLQKVLEDANLKMSHFGSAGHLASWAGLCPGHKQSGGKRLSEKLPKAVAGSDKP